MTAPKKCRVVGVLVEQERDCPDCAELRGETGKSGSGPARVATEAFRAGWEAAFSGRPAPRGQA